MKDKNTYFESLWSHNMKVRKPCFELDRTIYRSNKSLDSECLSLFTTLYQTTYLERAKIKTPHSGPSHLRPHCFLDNMRCLFDKFQNRQIQKKKQKTIGLTAKYIALKES